MNKTFDPPYKYLWRKYMNDYLDEIKDASDLRKHLIKTRNFQFTFHLPNDEVLIWKMLRENSHLSRHDEFFQGMIAQCPEFMNQLGVKDYEDFAKKLVVLTLFIKIVVKQLLKTILILDLNLNQETTRLCS